MSSLVLSRRARDLALVASITLIPLTGWAQPVPVLKETVVTGTRLPIPMTDRIADVTVIDRAEIERSAVSSVAELLARQHGVEMSSNGGPGSITGVFLRGAGNAQLLVLVDGQRIGSSTGGGATWASIPLGQIDRIEIVRGPASSLYGADAIGGVVQIFTRRGDGEPRVDAEFAMGSYRSMRSQVGASGASGPLRFSVRAGHERSNGFNAIHNPRAFGFNPDADGYKATNVGGNVGFTWLPGQDLELHFLENRVDAQYDSGLTFNNRNKYTLRTASLASVNQLSTRWTSRLRFGETADLGEDIAASGLSRFDTTQRQFLWQNDLRFDVVQAQLALERREERVSGTTAYPIRSRDTDSAVVVLQAAPGSHLAQASARFDDNSQYGRRTTGSLGYGYRFAPGWRANVSGGTAFRAPTFADLYFPNFDNPTLRPERARNGEVGVFHDTERLQTSLVYYRKLVEDQIVFTGGCPLAGRPFGCPVNVNRALLRGWTMSARLKATAAFSVRGTLDLAESIDRGTGRLLPRRSEERGTLGADYSHGAMTYTADWLMAGRRFDDAANTRRLGGYAIVDLGATYRMSRRWSLFARWHNVFDKRYELAADFARPGSSVFVGVRLQ